MDVTLPTGEVIKGVPDGMSKADLVTKLNNNGYDTSWYKPEPAAAPAEAVPAEPSMGQQLKRQLGLTARGLVNAVASPVTVGGNILGKAVNAVAGKEVFKPSTEVMDAYLAKAGLPEAAPGLETITQDVARSILPAARLERAIAASPTIAAGASGAVTNAALAKPGEEGREASYGALGGAIGAKGGEYLGRAGSKLLRPSTEAQNLMAKGVVPTLGQAVDRNTIAGTLVGNLEDVMSTSPFHYGQVARQREAVNKQFREAVLKDAEEGGLSRVPGTVREQIKALRGQAGEAFDELNKGLKVPYSNKVEGDMLGLASKNNLGAADQRDFTKFIADNYSSRFGEKTNLPYGIMDDMRQRAWDKVGETTGSLRQAYYDLASGLDTSRKSTMTAMGKPLQQTNANFSKARVLEDAANIYNPNKLAEDHLFSPTDYAKVARKQGVGGELGDLAHDASILTQSPNTRPRVNQALTVARALEGVGAYTSGGALPALLAGYQDVMKSPTIRKYLLGDKEVAQAVTNSLRRGGGTLGRITMVPPSEEQ